MYAAYFGGIEVSAPNQNAAFQMIGSDSGFPTAEERRARRAERLAELQFRRAKGYPLTRWEQFQSWLFA